MGTSVISTKGKMIRAVLFTLLVAAAYASPDDYIFGGRPASPNAWPWQVSLQRGTFHFCGGSLIGTRSASTHVITAAHCVSSSFSVTVVLGKHDRRRTSGNEVRLTSYDITPHESFRGSAPFPNDIALIKLPREGLSTRYYAPVALPSSSSQDFGPTDTCYITGWGRTLGTGDENILQELRIRANTLSECRDVWGSLILDSHICVGDGNSGSCNGDSGGPLVCRKSGQWVLAGATSWGIRGCNVPGFPSVYTRVSSFLSWINANK